MVSVLIVLTRPADAMNQKRVFQIRIIEINLKNAFDEMFKKKSDIFKDASWFTQKLRDTWANFRRVEF